MENGSISAIDTVIVVAYLLGIMATILLIVMGILYALLH